MEFREELLRVVEASRAEAGCLAIRAFESLEKPLAFAIHSRIEVARDRRVNELDCQGWRPGLPLLRRFAALGAKAHCLP